MENFSRYEANQSRIIKNVKTQRASSGPTHKRTEGRAPMWGSEFTSKAAKILDLIQTQVAQRRMRREEVYARALRLSQHVK
jgi:hypothetical protein